MRETPKDQAASQCRPRDEPTRSPQASRTHISSREVSPTTRLPRGRNVSCLPSSAGNPALGRPWRPVSGTESQRGETPGSSASCGKGLGNTATVCSSRWGPRHPSLTTLRPMAGVPRGGIWPPLDGHTKGLLACVPLSCQASTPTWGQCTCQLLYAMERSAFGGGGPSV